MAMSQEIIEDNKEWIKDLEKTISIEKAEHLNLQIITTLQSIQLIFFIDHEKYKKYKKYLKDLNEAYVEANNQSKYLKELKKYIKLLNDNEKIKCYRENPSLNIKKDIIILDNLIKTMILQLINRNKRIGRENCLKPLYNNEYYIQFLKEFSDIDVLNIALYVDRLKESRQLVVED